MQENGNSSKSVGCMYETSVEQARCLDAWRYHLLQTLAMHAARVKGCLPVGLQSACRARVDVRLSEI
eukprot:9883809-Alexandrium_andersonii.AAC.1